jgi:hypothetical protein
MQLVGTWLLSVLNEAVVAAALVAFAGWLLRRWIAERLTADIRLATEQKLQAFRARLDAAENEVVQQAGIAASLQMSAAPLAERVQAIKEIWLGVVDWKAASALSTMMSAFTIEDVDKHGDHPGTKSTMKQVLDSLKYMELLHWTNALARWRPFVSERAWALFAAYHGFYAARVTKAAMLMIGGANVARRLWQVDYERDLVRASATPEIVAAYEADIVAGSTRFLEYVERELLAELQRSLRGEYSGPDASRRASKIIAIADKLMQEARNATVA